MRKSKLVKQSGEMPWRIDAILSALTELNQRDQEYIYFLVMELNERQSMLKECSI